MAYERPVDDAHPGCLVLLLDRSYSMLEPIAGESDRSKAAAVAEVVNERIQRLAGDGRMAPTPCHLAVIGYGHEVGPCLTGSLGKRELVDASELAPHGPVWVEPVASGATPMNAALDRARSTVAAWVAAHPESFPPVVVNISDGVATDGHVGHIGAELQDLATNDGPTVVFNARVSSLAGESIVFVADDERLPDEGAHDLYRLSSVIPLRMHPAAHRLGQALEPGSRGLVINAGPQTLGVLLEIAMSPLVGDPEPVLP